VAEDRTRVSHLLQEVGIDTLHPSLARVGVIELLIRHHSYVGAARRIK
jgi:hypothetical protein